MSRLLIAGGVVATVGILAASAALGWAAQDRSDPRAAGERDPLRAPSRGEVRPAGEEERADQVPSIAGRWSILYIAGTAAGRRVAYVEPNLIVPITGDTISLPVLTGNGRDPVHYRSSMEYSTGRKGDFQIGRAHV